MKTVLIAIDQYAQNSDKPIKELKNAGIDVIRNDTGKPLRFDEYPDLFQTADYIIAGLEAYDAQTLSKCPNLRCISRVGVGTDNIDLAATRAAGVCVCITSDQPSVAVAELCIGNMISLIRHTHEMSTNLKQDKWTPIQGTELRDCNVGIVGLGSIGKELVRRLSNFSCVIKSASRSWNNDFALTYDIERLSLEELFATSNVISIHLPLEAQTRGIIDAKLISTMPKDSIILNTSRAAIVDNYAIAAALKANKLRGAAIDVFDEEPNADPYKQIPNVILSPHIGSHTRETRNAMEMMAAKNLITLDQFNSGNADTKKILSYLEKVTV
jgi:D-3-phosphoglycerate dehydrogenase